DACCTACSPTKVRVSVAQAGLNYASSALRAFEELVRIWRQCRCSREHGTPLSFSKGVDLMIRLPKWFSLALALGLVMLLGVPALADVKVKSVAPDTKMITVTDRDGKDWTYTLTDNARIFLGTGTPGRLNDLKAGDNVELLWEKRADKYFTNALLQRQGVFQN